jgi:hypothetical protein
MPVPPDGCDDTIVFDCMAWHRTKRLLTGAATYLLLDNAARGTHGGASRLRR